MTLVGQIKEMFPGSVVNIRMGWPVIAPGYPPRMAITVKKGGRVLRSIHCRQDASVSEIMKGLK